MNHISKMFKSSLRIIGLTTFIVVVSLVILYIKFGPGPEPGPTFPVDPKGEFIQQPTITTTTGTEVRWVVPSKKCHYNEIEMQEVDRLGQFGWTGGPADCVETTEGFICTSSLDNRGLVEGVQYNLQAKSSQCGAGSSYISEVIQFVL